MIPSELYSYLPLLIVLVICGGGLALAHYRLLARHKDLGSEARLPRQLVLLLLTIVSLVLFVIVSPLPDATRDQVLTLMGIALSAAIALSATSFVTNFMAAIMLRVTQPFRVGDFIKVGDMFGKVSERGLFDTEIQTENRELIAIPNATFINQSVVVMRSSGVIIFTTMSLGYDIDSTVVEPLMEEAAVAAGLNDPYVHIIGLGDFSISYRICGLLTDIEAILTARSELNRQLLRTLHNAGIEIVSPTITRHITQSADEKIMPPASYSAPREKAVLAEDIVFDKANDVARLESTREELRDRIQVAKDSKEPGFDPTHLLEQLARIEKELQALRKES
jgi:small-conductance mechanosensitive channel